MPSLAMKGAVFAPGVVPTKTLTVGGREVLKQASAATNRFGVPIETVSVTERGPGGVSSMNFSIEDINSEITITDGQEVVFTDVTWNYPIFRGFLSQWTRRPHEGGRGRWFDIQCAGIESWLDWALMPNDVTIAAGLTDASAVQSLVYQCSGAPLNIVGAQPGAYSSKTAPVSRFNSLFVQESAVTVSAGTTLREAIRQVLTQNSAVPNGYGLIPGLAAILFTVDFYGGLRTYYHTGAGTETYAEDFQTLTVTDDAVSMAVPAATGLTHETDAAGIVRGVYVKGATAGSSGIFTDGTGLPGRMALISDPDLDTAAKALAAARTYLGENTSTLRGSFGLVDELVDVNSWDVRAGSPLVLTDVQTGIPTNYRVMELERSFGGGSIEQWKITYNGLAPSVVNLIRRWTYGTRV